MSVAYPYKFPTISIDINNKKFKIVQKKVGGKRVKTLLDLSKFKVLFNI